MRWSLILSAFIAVQSALSFVCVALAVPPSSDGLERRARPRAKPDVRSNNDQHRKNARNHPNAYHFEGLGPNNQITEEARVTKKPLKKEERREHADKLINSQTRNRSHQEIGKTPVRQYEHPKCMMNRCLCYEQVSIL